MSADLPSHSSATSNKRNRANQLQRASDSTASNYRAACIARSHREFVAKISIALEEVDEAVGWLEMSHRDGSLRGAETMRLLDEGRQIARILAASRNTAQAREDISVSSECHEIELFVMELPIRLQRHRTAD